MIRLTVLSTKKDSGNRYRWPNPMQLEKQKQRGIVEAIFEGEADIGQQ